MWTGYPFDPSILAKKHCREYSSFFNAKGKVLFSVLVLGKFCSRGQDSFPLPGGFPASRKGENRKGASGWYLLKMKEDLHRDCSPFKKGEKEHPSCYLVLLLCVWLAIRADRQHTECPYKWLSNSLKVDYYQFLQRNLIKPLLLFHCWIFFPWMHRCVNASILWQQGIRKRLGANFLPPCLPTCLSAVGKKTNFFQIQFCFSSFFSFVVFHIGTMWSSALAISKTIELPAFSWFTSHAARRALF